MYQRFVTAQREVDVRLKHAQGEPLPLLWLATDRLGVGMRAPKISGGAVVSGGNATEWEDQIWAQVADDLEEAKIASRSVDVDTRQALFL
jgi:hypothetical protein